MIVQFIMLFYYVCSGCYVGEPNPSLLEVMDFILSAARVVISDHYSVIKK